MASSAVVVSLLLFLTLLLIGVRPVDGASLAFLARRGQPRATSSQQSCSELVNHGTHFTVDVEVGTPGQKFSIIADTGSNVLIVPSCVCQASGSCEKTDRCFTGTNRSSSFSVINGTHGPAGMLLSFGSGQVQGVLAKETVLVGQARARMDEGILLMTAKALHFGGSFEGILGLGIPQKPEAVERMPLRSPGQHNSSGAVPPAAPGDIQEALKKIIDAIKARGAAGGAVGQSGQVPAMPTAPRMVANEEVPTLEDAIAFGGALETPETAPAPRRPGGFLEQAGIGRFSMCFNPGASGVLRIGDQPVHNAHGSIGKEHWGLDFRGVSVGSKSVPVEFCSSKNLTNGQQSACGAIPDSGTTLIMAPKEHLSALFQEVCDSWDRCKRNYTALVAAAHAASHAAEEHYGLDPFNIKVSSDAKGQVFQYLLEDCDSWLDEGEGLDELPPLAFHVAGSNGTTQALRLPGSAYVFAVQGKEGADTAETSRSNGAAPANRTEVVHGAVAGAGSRKRLCQPAFGPMDYPTKANGPIWILGTPFFYEYTVGYDLFASPPAISFTSTSESPCGQCDREVGLVSAGVAPARSRHPRVINGAPRMPTIDRSRPL